MFIETNNDFSESLSFCGKDINVKTSQFKIKQNSWNSLELLANISRETLKINKNYIEELEPALWIDVATEYDAENFCNHIGYLQQKGSLNLSDNFMAFERAWRRDEFNHTTGFVRFYSILYQIPESQVWTRLKARPVNFEPISHFFKEEFTICVMLAFDELATTRFYVDHLDRYVAFENPTLLQWIRALAKDEAMHLSNILDVIRIQHGHRLSEVPTLLKVLAEWDNDGADYGATFVLDHEGGQLDSQFIARNCAIICNRLGIKDSH